MLAAHFTRNHAQSDATDLERSSRCDRRAVLDDFDRRQVGGRTLSNPARVGMAKHSWESTRRRIRDKLLDHERTPLAWVISTRRWLSEGAIEKEFDRAEAR
jgi:hypothetical protein